ncbi:MULTISPECIES: class I SAM-dependent methyltransferase [unclassified Frankia]|uniref:THUMP-like domain-containing protein n=1 Tax=unclassified Frankia TaxID=2632575 RepID=UPI0027DB1158|nr:MULTISPECIES: class I SAM-dependent methyltransferase [unclassified Frankia]
MLFTRAGLEQSTSEALARHRAKRFAGLGRVADLCTGIGGDLLALAATGQPLVAVDRDPGHLRIAVHNAHVYAPTAAIDARCEDVRAADLTGVRAVFVDPARRSGARRFSPGASEPPLDWCLALAERVPAVAVKAAPGLPTELVPPGWEIEFVADGRDLKEAALYSPALTSGASRRATVLLASGAAPAATLAGEPDPPDPGARTVSDPGAFLYDPSPAVTRAGLVGTLGRQLEAWQIDPMIAFLTSDQPVDTPFARLLRIETSLPFDVRRLAALLRTMGISALDLRRRGLAGDVDTLRRRLLPDRRELVPGGPAVTVVMTRHHDQPWAFVCTSR